MPVHRHLIPHFRGFQGANPKNPRYIFIGKDANFPGEFQEGHKIWSCLTAYLSGEKRHWLSRRGRAERSAHHPALVNAWPWGPGAAYHSTFAEIFECVDEHGIVDIRSKCSFVELLCWPTTAIAGEIPLDQFLRLFQGEPIDPHVQPDLRRRFPACQRRHRRDLRRWLRNAHKVFVPRAVFKLLCQDRAHRPQDGPVAPEIASLQLQQEVDGHFAEHHNPHPNWWIFDSRHPIGPQLPRLIVTKFFPWFRGRGQPVGLRATAIRRICAIIARNEAAPWIHITGFSAEQLRRAADLKERIEVLQEELNAILGGAD